MPPIGAYLLETGTLVGGEFAWHKADPETMPASCFDAFWHRPDSRSDQDEAKLNDTKYEGPNVSAKYDFQGQKSWEKPPELGETT